MTKIKIPFTENKLSHIPTDKLAPGAHGLELEISTNFLVFYLAGSFENAVPPNVFIFEDNNTETAFCQSLCDNNQKQFELSFDRDQEPKNSGLGELVGVGLVSLAR